MVEDTSPFCGGTDTPVLDFWWCLLWVSKPKWAALFMHGKCVQVTCPWDSPQVQHLPTLYKAAKPISCTYPWPGIGGGSKLGPTVLQANTIPTELLVAQLPVISRIWRWLKMRRLLCFIAHSQCTDQGCTALVNGEIYMKRRGHHLLVNS